MMDEIHRKGTQEMEDFLQRIILLKHLPIRHFY